MKTGKHKKKESRTVAQGCCPICAQMGNACLNQAYNMPQLHILYFYTTVQKFGVSQICI